MLQPKVVLAPTDFSAPSLDAIETAADVASRFGSVLVLVHAVPALPRLPPSVSLFKEADYEQSLHDRAVQQVADLAAKYEKAGVMVKSEVAIANEVGMEILRTGDRYGTDLIVIATHGMTGWREFAFGSVAEKVVRLARCAVLVLKVPRAAG